MIFFHVQAENRPSKRRQGGSLAKSLSQSQHFHLAYLRNMDYIISIVDLVNSLISFIFMEYPANTTTLGNSSPALGQRVVFSGISIARAIEQFDLIQPEELYFLSCGKAEAKGLSRSHSWECRAPRVLTDLKHIRPQWGSLIINSLVTPHWYSNIGLPW